LLAPSRVSTRRTATSPYWPHWPPARWSVLSNTSSTLARLACLRVVGPLKITSCIDSPRNSLALLSPSTQRTASMMLDFPQPLDPTTPTNCPGSMKVVGSENDVNPDSLIEVRRTGQRTEVAPDRRSAPAGAPVGVGRQSSDDTAPAPCARRSRVRRQRFGKWLTPRTGACSCFT